MLKRPGMHLWPRWTPTTLHTKPCTHFQCEALCRSCWGRELRGPWLYCGRCQATKSKYTALQTSARVTLSTEGRRALARRRRRRRRVTCTSAHVAQPANNELKTKTGVRLHLPLLIVFPQPLRNVSHIIKWRDSFPPERINCQTLFGPCCFSLAKNDYN